MLQFDREKIEFKENGRPLDLTLVEMRVLGLLDKNSNNLVFRKTILEKIWPGVFVTSRTVDVHIFRIRKELHDHEIVGVRNKGYLLREKLKSTP